MRAIIDLCLVLVYVGMIVIANGVVSRYGQEALPFTAFMLIPLDLVVRDLLQDRWQIRRRGQMYAMMLTLIFGGSLVSYWTTIASPRIATASMAAFCLTGMIDLLTYQAMVKLGRVFRINAATVVAAITDTLIFVAIAFDNADTMLVVYQIAAKCCGGLFWSLVLYRFFRSSNVDVQPRDVSRVVPEPTAQRPPELKGQRILERARELQRPHEAYAYRLRAGRGDGGAPKRSNPDSDHLPS